MPEIRFPEFSGEWRSAKGRNAFGKRIAKGEAGLPIWSVTIDRGLVPRGSLERKGDDAADGSNIRAQPGDLVYNTMRMWQGAVGRATEECMLSPAYVVLAPKRDTVSKLFEYWFKAPRMLHRLWAYSHGLTSDRLRLYYDDFAQIPMALPTPAEQEKIAAFLGAVDARLEGLRREKSLLTDYKTGLMQRIFARDLRLRFADGTAFPEWSTKKLRRVAMMFSGGTPKVSSESFFGGQIPFIKSAEIRATATEEFLSPAGLANSAAKTIEKGDLLFALYGANAGEVALSKLDGAINQAVLCIRPTMNRRFLFQYLGFMRSSFRARFLQGGQGNLSAEIVKELEVPIPHSDEQRKIADALGAIDSKIDAVAAQINQLETFKRGLLQKMFV